MTNIEPGRRINLFQRAEVPNSSWKWKWNEQGKEKQQTRFPGSELFSKSSNDRRNKNKKKKEDGMELEGILLGPGAGYGAGCGVGAGFGLVGGFGFTGSSWNHVELVFGVGVGCGIGFGLGYGQGLGFGSTLDWLKKKYISKEKLDRDRRFIIHF